MTDLVLQVQALNVQIRALTRRPYRLWKTTIPIDQQAARPALNQVEASRPSSDLNDMEVNGQASEPRETLSRTTHIHDGEARRDQAAPREETKSIQTPCLQSGLEDVKHESELKETLKHLPSETKEEWRLRVLRKVDWLTLAPEELSVVYERFRLCFPRTASYRCAACDKCVGHYGL